MTLPKKAISRAALVLVSLAFGCGDDGDDGGASGVDKDKAASDVTQAEAKKICEWQEGLDDSVTTRQGCTIDAVLSSTSTAQCEEAVEDCIDDEAADNEELDDDNDCSDVEAPANLSPGCDEVTVGQYESCLKSYLDKFKSVASKASCEDLTSVRESDFATPEACKDFEIKCPELLGGDIDG